MYGPAGSGKTAIAQSIAEECKRKGLLATSFFFSRTAAMRNDTTRFVATIAYQLSRSVPEISDNIISAIEKELTIFSLTLDVQMQVLVIEPLQMLPPLARPILVITDGVDECGPSRESHTTLLNTLGTAMSELQHIPLIFLIASRPEYEIREAFNGSLLSPLARSLVLDNTYNPDDDIRLYLNSKFQEVHDKHLRLGSSLPSPWPANTDVDRLVSKASGQFIFASTVMKFIDTSRHDPQERLQIILGLSAPGNATPFALLDALYHFILASVADLPRVLEILKFLILANYKSKDWSLEPTVEVLEAFLGFVIGPVMVDMHALVFIPSNRRLTLRVYHASLYDFLTDQSRSHIHYINITQGHIAFSQRWEKIMTDYGPYLPASLSLTDCVNGFVMHCRQITTMSSELADALASFSLKMLLDRIRGYKDLYSPRWDDFFVCIKEPAFTQGNTFLRLCDEFDNFILERLSKYPPDLQTLIPIIIYYSSTVEAGVIQDIFHLSFNALNPSKMEFTDVVRLDSTLLDLYNAYSDSSIMLKAPFSTLFEDRSRARQFFVDNRSYTTLMKQIIKVVRPMPGRDLHQVEFLKYGHVGRVFNSNNPYPSIKIPTWIMGEFGLPYMISNTATDLEFGVLLLGR